MKHRLTIIFALLFALFLVACGGAAPEPAPDPAEEPAAEEVMEEEAMEEEMAEEEAMEEEVAPSIAEIAVADGNFTTLVAALDAAGLVETLSGEGAFTVFAPTDDALIFFGDRPPEWVIGVAQELSARPVSSTRDLIEHSVEAGLIELGERAVGLLA